MFSARNQKLTRPLALGFSFLLIALLVFVGGLLISALVTHPLMSAFVVAAVLAPMLVPRRNAG